MGLKQLWVCACLQEVANTLWAVATLDHNPGAALLDAAAVQILRRIEQFAPPVCYDLTHLTSLCPLGTPFV